MSENKSDDILSRIDGYSLFTDLLKSLPAIVGGALSVFLCVMMFLSTRVTPVYTTDATFVVMSKNYSNYVSSNLSAASSMATGFSNILNSDVMKKRICESLGMESFDATLKASIIKDTNLLELKVSAKSPQEAYSITQYIIKNYADLTSYFNANTVMMVLKAPDVPTRSDDSASVRHRAKRAAEVSFVLLVLAFAALSVTHNTVKSSRDLTEKLDAQELGVIPFVSRRKRGKAKDAGGLLVTDADVGFSFAEGYQRVTTRVVHQCRNRDAKTILVTSVAEHEGKSTLAANLAVTLALQGKVVYLLDCDFRRPSQAKIFNMKDVSEEDCLQSLLAGKNANAKMIYTHKRSGLRVFYTSPKQVMPGEDTAVVMLSALIQFLVTKGKADYVILDTPPMSLMADAEEMADLADVSLLAVKYDAVDARDINDTIDRLKNCHAEFIGCVLNMVHKLGNSLPGYGYGRYGRYGKYGRYGRYGRYAERKLSTEEEASHE